MADTRLSRLMELVKEHEKRMGVRKPGRIDASDAKARKKDVESLRKSFNLPASYVKDNWATAKRMLCESGPSQTLPKRDTNDQHGVLQKGGKSGETTMKGFKKGRGDQKLNATDDDAEDITREVAKLNLKGATKKKGATKTTATTKAQNVCKDKNGGGDECSKNEPTTKKQLQKQQKMKKKVLSESVEEVSEKIGKGRKAKVVGTRKNQKAAKGKTGMKSNKDLAEEAEEERLKKEIKKQKAENKMWTLVGAFVDEQRTKKQAETAEQKKKLKKRK